MIKIIKLNTQSKYNYKISYYKLYKLKILRYRNLTKIP